MNKTDALLFSKAVGELVSGLIDADKNGDGKYGMSEIWKVVSYKTVLRDIKSADSYERQIIASEFTKYFNLSDKDMECLVEMWIQTLVNISDSIEETKSYLKNRK